MDQLCALVFLFSILISGARGIGVNYGLMGDNLPNPAQTKTLLQSRGITEVRLFEPNHDVLDALKGSGISVVLGTRNEDLSSFCSDPSSAANWVQANVAPYSPSITIRFISVGNELVPGPLADFIHCAMQRLDSALKAANLAIPVTTVVHMSILGPSFPPSNGNFSDEASKAMTEITSFLALKNTPLLLNAYAWWTWGSDRANIPLDYALLQEGAKQVQDGVHTYNNLFDAMLDTVYAALERVGGSNVEIIVAETGWPTGGDEGANVQNAQIHNSNLIKHVASGKGTPRRPGKGIDAYIFSLFNENMKPSGVEQNWGLFYPSMNEVYHLEFVA